MRLRDAVEAISEAFVLWDTEQPARPVQFEVPRPPRAQPRGRHPGPALRRDHGAGRAAAGPARAARHASRPAPPPAPSRPSSPTAAGCRSASAAPRTAATSRSAPTSPASSATRSSCVAVRARADRHRARPQALAPDPRAPDPAARRPRRALPRPEGAGRERQPGQIRVPRQHEPRAAHAAQRDHRLRRADGERGLRHARLAALRRLLPRHPLQRRLPALGHRRHPQHVADRGPAGDARARARSRSPRRSRAP